MCKKQGFSLPGGKEIGLQDRDHFSISRALVFLGVIFLSGIFFEKFVAMEKVIALGVLGLLAFRAKKKVDAVYEFKYSPAGFPKVLFDKGSAIIALPVRISNNTNESFQINGFSGKVFINGSFVSDFNVLEPVSLGEYGSAVFTIQFTVPLLGAAITLVKAITEGLGNQVIQVRGQAKLSAIYIPVLFDYRL